MKPYPTYKDSGIEWIGEIPEHWDVVQIKRLSPVKRGASPRPIEDPKYFDDNGEFAWVRIADVSSSDRYLESTTQTLSELGASLSVKRYPGDLFLSIAGTVGKPIITTIKCCIHDGFVWFPNLKINPEYLYYIFSAGEAYKGLGKWGTQLNLNTETVGSIPLPFPPEEVELEEIINFLDYKTSQIDTLIEKKQKQIELLQEERTAIINQAVTKGLNPDVPMKDSGIEWLGQVPEHWRTNKIKYCTYVKGRIGWQGLTSEEYIDEGALLVTGTDFDNGVINWSGCHHITEERYDQDTKIQLRENDLLITKDGTIGKIALVKDLTSKATLNSGVFITRPLNNEYNTEFMYWILNSKIFNEYVEYTKTGSTIQHLYQDTFVNFSFALPEIEEQKAIIRFLKKEYDKKSMVIENAEEQITHLQEYRIALISNAVTGKIDVRDTPTVILG